MANRQNFFFKSILESSAISMAIVLGDCLFSDSALGANFALGRDMTAQRIVGTSQPLPALVGGYKITLKLMCLRIVTKQTSWV